MSRSDHRSIDLEKFWLFGLLLAALLLYSINLGSVALRDWDEATYAMAARGMVESGNWLHPKLLDEPYLNKPPLGQWMIASSYSLFGINEWSTRLPMALTSALAVPLVFLLGKTLFSTRTPAWLASLVYLTWLPVARHGRLAMLDGSIISLFLVMLLCYLYGRKQTIWLGGLGICFGLMALLKGVLAILLGGICLGLLLLERNQRLLRHPYLWLGFGLGVLPLVGWYIAQGNFYGSNFWQVHFFNQALSRTWDSVDQNTGPVWFYLLEILKYGWPWLIFLPVGLWQAWQQRQTSWAKLAIWGSLLYLVVISAMRTKLPWYLQPIYPGLALAIGVELADWQQRLLAGKTKGRFFWLGWSVLFILVGGAAGILYARAGNYYVSVIGGIIALTFSFSAIGVWQQRAWSWLGLIGGLYLSLFVLFLSPTWIWELNETFAVKPVAYLIQAQVPAKTTVYTSFAYSRPSLNFYSQRSVIPLQSEPIERLLKAKAFLLLDDETLNSLDPKTYNSLGMAEDFALIRGR